jgi:AcrR family transcriptional regulator
MLSESEKTDPRVKRTRQLLQNALIELAQEKPLDKISVQDIAARAEVNRATFYAHFEDKHALLNYMMREMFQAKLDEKMLDETAPSLKDVRLLTLATCEFLGDFIGHCPPVLQFDRHAIMFVQLQTYLYETLLKWMTPSSGAETAAMTTSWAIWGSAFQWARNDRKTPAARLADQVLALLQSGLEDYLRDERITA